MTVGKEDVCTISELASRVQAVTLESSAYRQGSMRILASKRLCLSSRTLFVVAAILFITTIYWRLGSSMMDWGSDPGESDYNQSEIITFLES